ncbi:MAG: hypothetical protein ACI4XQ_07150, partial [Eubacteriales bacterium]
MQTENDTVSRIAFDLTADGRLCSGELIFSHGVLRASIGGETVFERGVQDCAELKQFTDIGCGALELAIRDPEAGKPAGDGDQPKALDDSENIRICRFTMAHVNEAAELCKVVNYYITTGSENRIVYSERRRCEKCGRPLMQGTDICMFCVDKGYILNGASGTKFDTSMTLFVSGKAAMLNTGTWSVGAIQAANPDLDFSVLLYPGPGGNLVAGVAPAQAVGIFKGSAHQ